MVKTAIEYRAHFICSQTVQIKLKLNLISLELKMDVVSDFDSIWSK